MLTPRGNIKMWSRKADLSDRSTSLKVYQFQKHCTSVLLQLWKVITAVFTVDIWDVGRWQDLRILWTEWGPTIIVFSLLSLISWFFCFENKFQIQIGGIVNAPLIENTFISKVFHNIFPNRAWKNNSWQIKSLILMWIILCILFLHELNQNMFVWWLSNVTGHWCYAPTSDPQPTGWE